ncbi:hypothetical protein R1sor_011139 [Riccia sorocarpa]|uniref:Uncharacterized protein n=1 Tax=Riccia sorocarpa TaxID=122646 RepID=A0ABD3I015_9MARC
MIFGQQPSPSKVFKELQGIHLVHSSKGDTFEEDGPGTLQCAGRGSQLRSAPVYVKGTQLLPAPQDQPIWKTAWESRPPWFRLLDCEHNGDRNLLETVVNVVTSLPFVVVGLQTPRKKPAARMYGNSLIGVGMASCFYHVSRGEARKLFRFGDYAMIATAAVCLTSALRDDTPRALMLASAMFIPVQPMLVTVLHTGLMEATFLRRAQTEPKLKRAHSLHTLSSVVGSALFVADDLYPNTPYIHAAWHLAAALGVATCTKLLE